MARLARHTQRSTAGEQRSEPCSAPVHQSRWWLLEIVCMLTRAFNMAVLIGIHLYIYVIIADVALDESK
jgi:hypothetical protein